MPKPPPRHPRPDPSKTSPQASRQQNALFKGLARQMTGLSALGLPNSPELQRWRATVEEDHQARRPGRKPKGSAAAKRKQKPKPKTETERADASDAARRSRRRRKCGVCGGEGHNARTCALAPPRRDSEDLVSYYEAKYGNLGSGIGIQGSSASLVSVARNEKNAKRKKKKPSRPAESLALHRGAVLGVRRPRAQPAVPRGEARFQQEPARASGPVHVLVVRARRPQLARVPRAPGRRRRLRLRLRVRLRPRVRDRVRGREGHGRLGFRVSRGAFARSERR